MGFSSIGLAPVNDVQLEVTEQVQQPVAGLGGGDLDRHRVTSGIEKNGLVREHIDKRALAQLGLLVGE